MNKQKIWKRFGAAAAVICLAACSVTYPGAAEPDTQSMDSETSDVTLPEDDMQIQMDDASADADQTAVPDQQEPFAPVLDDTADPDLESDGQIRLDAGEPEGNAHWSHDDVTDTDYYIGEDGSVQKGWIQIEDQWYYLDEETGARQEDCFAERDGRKYYLAKETGEVVKDGWLELEGQQYYLDPETGSVQIYWTEVDQIWYYMNADGVVQTGWKWIGQKWYYFEPESGAMETGWVYTDDTWYYMNGSGAMQTGWIYTGGVWYYMNSSGAMQTGWVYTGGKWYYMNGSGAMQTGWVYTGGKWYYMNSSGAMQTGWVSAGSVWYYMNSSGAMQTGWVSTGGKWYYMNSSGAMQTGWVRVNDLYYYLNTSGAMEAGKVVDGYKLNADGSNQTKVLVKDIVDSKINNAMTNDQKIKTLWDWIVGNSWTYTRTYEHVSSSWVWYSGWQDDFARQLIQNNSGNCFRYAAGFGYMVKEATGYRVCVYHGMTPASRGGVTPHGWITVEIGNTWYAYDPDLYKFSSKKSIYYKTDYQTTRKSIHLSGSWVPLY